MDTQRLILFLIFSFSVLLLWDAWQKEQRLPAVPAPAAKTVPAVPAPATPLAVPAPTAPSPASAPSAAPAAKGETVRVRTDLLIAEIDTLGGTLSRVELLKHKQAGDLSGNLVLLGPDHQYFAQSGLAGATGPNHRSVWRAQPGARELAPGASSLEVRLSAESGDGLVVDKVFTFARDSSLVEVARASGR